MLKVDIVRDKESWEKFLLSQNYQPFFQSWNWAELQQLLGNETFRFGLYNKSKLVGICLAVLIKARRGHYLHFRHGPLFSNFYSQFDPFMESLKEKSQALKIDFIRTSPLIEEASFEFNFLKKRGFRNAPIHNMDAENAWVLDLDKTEVELLRDMRKTTRYLIKKGKTSNLEIIKAQSTPDLNSFLKLYQKTAAKHHFVPHRGIKEEFEIFKKDNQAVLFLAKFKKRVICGALVIFYGNQAIYHHGATDPAYERLSPSYLVQWEAIKEVKKRGKKIYNFWGVVPPDKSNHPWQGLTLFKTGFGGRRINFIHAQDLPLTLGYWKTYFIESMIKISKGY